MPRALKPFELPPPWAKRLRLATRAGRAISWIEKYVTIPSGRFAGDPLKLHPYQTELLEILLAEDQNSGGWSLPAGNAKSALASAIGLWSLCDADDAPQTVLLAVNGTQAIRTLYTPMKIMVNQSDVLEDWVQVRRDNQMRGFACEHNNGNAWVMPAEESRLQGLVLSLALVDEGEFITDLEILLALQDRLGKRGGGELLLCFGTPSDAQTSVLSHMREMAAAGGAYAWREHGAPMDADIRARSTWEAANPALAAGILSEDVFHKAIANIDAAVDPSAKLVLTNRFRRYRLGQWVTGPVESGWLPPGSWEACPTAPPPLDGERVVLAVDGTYKRSTAVTAATLEEPNAVTLLYAGEGVDDNEVEQVIVEACERWAVAEIAYYPTIRPQLIGQLDRRGLPIVEWKLGRQDETKATNSLWQAITEGTFVHDGSRLLGEHFRNVTARDTPAGVVLRRVHRDDAWIDAAMSARMSWWRSLELVRLTPSVW